MTAAPGPPQGEGLPPGQRPLTGTRPPAGRGRRINPIWVAIVIALIG